MPKLRVSLGIGYPGAKHVDEIEIDDDEWDELTEEEREEFIDQLAVDWAWNYIDIGVEVVE